MVRSALAAMFAAPIIAGCAAMPEPCTAEWFDWKTERIVGDFVHGHRDQIGRLRDAAPVMFGPEGGLEQIAPTSMLVLTAIGAVELALDFAREAWPEISDAVAECSAPPRASRLFADMLRREGVDERAVRAIEELGSMMDTKP